MVEGEKITPEQTNFVNGRFHIIHSGVLISSVSRLIMPCIVTLLKMTGESISSELETSSRKNYQYGDKGLSAGVSGILE